MQHPVDDFNALTARVNSGGAPSGKHNEDYPTLGWAIVRFPAIQVRAVDVMAGGGVG